MKQDTLKGRRVLVVEDEAIIAMLIEDMLAELGCALVDPASDARKALSIIESERFDAAILDVNLDGARTTPIAEELRSRGIPFLFATGYGAAELEAEFKRYAVLTKPFRQSELESALRGLLCC
jgi:CheY-like chemotaxis protein